MIALVELRLSAHNLLAHTQRLRRKPSTISQSCILPLCVSALSENGKLLWKSSLGIVVPVLYAAS